MKARKIRTGLIDLGSAKSATKGPTGFVADEVLTRPIGSLEAE